MPTNSIPGRNSCEEATAAGAQPLPPDVTAGAAVQVRGERFRLDALVPHADCCEMHLVHASAARPRILLWPFDRPGAVQTRGHIRAVRPRKWLRALSRHTAAEIDPATPRGQPRDVDVIPYQLAPALAMNGGRPRVLLADEVGLGKTMQAGWILLDLIARAPGARALIAVPASVRRQWIDELSRRFGIDAACVDARWLRAAVADLPFDVSPWAAPGVYVASIDFLKRPDVAESARRFVWDLLIVDEAHTATAPTERHAAVAALAARSRRIVTITATPYCGDPDSFTSMTALGGADGGPGPLMFRRSREETGDRRVRRHRFVTVRVTPAETRLQRLLERYSRAVWRDASGGTAARLAVTILRKRALSSPAAAARSLRRRQQLLGSRPPEPLQLALFADADDVSDDEPSAALGASGLADAALEQRWLASLIDAADAAAGIDSKLAFLHRLLRRLGNESAVVFTEYRDTLVRLAGALPGALQLHGGLNAGERDDVQRAFNREGGLLLATDAAAEGLNLQGRCRVVVNYELPWNPGRLEQRIGRVDRIGQSRPVHALTLTAADTAEDLVIKNLVRRLTSVVATLGARDRLGMFLDESRMAAIVIAGAAAEATAAPRDVLIERAAAPSAAESRAAALLRARTAVRQDASDAPDVLVASIRARRMPPGYVAVLACSARTGDGVLIARRLLALHIQAVPERPADARSARRLAEAVLPFVGDARRFDPSLDRWFEDVCREHRAAIAAMVARERTLAGDRRQHGLIQAGLFDVRAVRAAIADAERHEMRISAHRIQIQALERSRTPHLSVEPVLFLIAWR